MVKNGTRDFQKNSAFERWDVFMWQSVEILNFNFWKTKISFKKLEYLFLIESTKIENASFPYKTAISEANVKINRMLVLNGPITKNGVLPGILFFWGSYSYKVLIWCMSIPNAYIRNFFYTLEYYLMMLFPCEYP